MNLAVGAQLSADANLSADLEAFYDAWEVFDLRDTISANLVQPLLRDIRYRAYERAYTAVLNDPNLFVLNVPTHKIAFPPLTRTLETSFIRYEATVLPEADPAPWVRHGTGTATIQSGSLVVGDTSGGVFPAGQPIFWTKALDLTFDHVFAMAFHVSVDVSPVPDGVFTGVAAGYSDDKKALVLGFLLDGSTRKIGILQKGFGDDPSTLASWTGGVDSTGAATGLPAAFDWSTLHSYRVFKDTTGTLSIFTDGEVVATLTISPDNLPFLEELAGPFDQMQGAFFGSISRPAQNSSSWDFVRYQIIPTNPFQTAPSSFVSYEATVVPELATPAWTPIGYHGTETISSGELILDSTSATTVATEEDVGLVGGDFKGFVRLEPLLSVSSDVALDWDLQIRTLTNGTTPNAILAAIDDGDRLTQACFFQDESSPKVSYGGRSFPDASTPIAWETMGTAPVTMAGRELRIADTSTTDGRLYFIDDTTASNSPLRVAGNDGWIMEFRVEMELGAYTPDPLGFAGVAGQVYDGTRSVGVIFEDRSSVRYVTLASDGQAVTGGRFAFEWNDGAIHTYRMVKSSTGGVVSLFIDTIFIGSVSYAVFSNLVPSLSMGVYSFGSSTASSTTSLSTARWSYFNVWRIVTARRYVGLWKGYDPSSLTGYHLPLKAAGSQAKAVGNTITDTLADFVGSGVVVGDRFIIDDGANKGIYIVASVIGSHTLTLDVGSSSHTVGVFENVGVRDQASVFYFNSTSNTTDSQIPVSDSVFFAESLALNGSFAAAGDNTYPSTKPPVVTTSTPLLFPVYPTQVAYRIPKETDWTVSSRYRLVRDPAGGVSLFQNATATPLLRIEYNQTTLPPSSAGILQTVGNGIPCIAFGAFDPTNLSQTVWDYVRYGISRAPVETKRVPPHQVLNQRNIVVSPDHLTTSLPHTHTDFWSSSGGVPPQIDPDLLRNPALVAYTRLNQGTPIVPLTQTSEIRVPIPILVPASDPILPFNVLNPVEEFESTDGAFRVRLLVPDDVLYNSIQVIEDTSGEPEVLAIGSDSLTSLGTLSWTNEVCLTYDATTIPENDTTASTPWVLVSDDPSQVTVSAAFGILTYSTLAQGTRTVYRNDTPLTDPPGIINEFTFRVKVVTDASNGLGDSQVRVGFSAPGLTLALGFMTTPLGERRVVVYDVTSNQVVGGLPFDFFDGDFHTYRIVKDSSMGVLDLFIDS